jgi:plasmid rolling circle replication initiator protein Rep
MQSIAIQTLDTQELPIHFYRKKLKVIEKVDENGVLVRTTEWVVLESKLTISAKQELYNNLPTHYPGDVWNDSKFDFTKYKRLNEDYVDRLVDIFAAGLIKHTILDIKKIKRIYTCANTLEYVIDSSGKAKLYKTNFCHHPGCPLCIRRKAEALHKDLHDSTNAFTKQMDEQGIELRALHLVLSTPNVTSDQLKNEFALLHDGFRELMRLFRSPYKTPDWLHVKDDKGITHHIKQYDDKGDLIYKTIWKPKVSRKTGQIIFDKKHPLKAMMVGEILKKKLDILGYFKKVEITYSHEHNNWNPHVHVLLFVDKAKYDIKNPTGWLYRHEWLDCWKIATGRDDIQNIKIEEIEFSAKSIKEFSKYMTKMSDIMNVENLGEDKCNELIAALLTAIDGERLIAYGGGLAEVRRDSGKSEDLENIDLIGAKDKDLKKAIGKFTADYHPSRARQYLIRKPRPV